MTDALLFNGVLLLYAAAMIGYLASLLSRRVTAAKVGAWVLTAAFVLHTLVFVFQAVERSSSPVINRAEALSFFAWAAAGIYLAIQWKGRVKVLGAFITPVLVILMIMASSHCFGSNGVPPLTGGLVTIHIILSIAAEALFLLAGLAGLVYLIQNEFLKHRKIGGLSRVLPSLGDLDRVNGLCLSLGFVFLTLGITVGSFWARIVWGPIWNGDPKQVSTLIIWLVYAFLLHQRVAIGWNGRKAAIGSLAAILLICFSLIGVSEFLKTTHHF